jgi:hypothetical protein
MRTETEIAEKFERLNSLVITLKKKHKYADIPTCVAHIHTMSALAWVLGMANNVAIESQLERLLNE